MLSKPRNFHQAAGCASAFCASRCSPIATAFRRPGRAHRRGATATPRTERRWALAASEDRGSSTSSVGGGLSPILEQAVPEEQRPVNELAQLKDSGFFSWATLTPAEYLVRFAAVWVTFVFLIAAPVAAGSFDPAKQPIEFVLAGATGGLLVVSVLLLRIYLGWAYVGNRLLSATVEYEETGWYDGQVFVKPPEVLTRDRLLGTYQVKPVLTRLRQTLLTSAASLVLSSLVLAGVIKINGPMETQIPKPREINMQGIIYSSKVRSLEQLLYDDDAAEAEAAATNGVPGYCADRYFRAAAGGQYCAKFDGSKK